MKKKLGKKNSEASVFFLLPPFALIYENPFSSRRALAWPLLLRQQLRLLQRLRLPEMLAKVREEPVKKAKVG